MGVALRCRFDKASELPIPQDPTSLFVECYLQDSLPPRLLLSQTQQYFDEITLSPINAGIVELETPSGDVIQLKSGTYIDADARKVYNWAADVPIYLKAGQIWKLRASDTNGHVISATSIVMQKIVPDSIVYIARDNDTAVFCTSWQKDPPGQVNYYRLIVNQDTLSAPAKDDILFADNFRDGQQFPIRTGFSLALNRTLFVRLYSVEPTYYAFLASVSRAQRNNGNPFAQPNRLQSAIQGGYGVFTTLVYAQKSFVTSARRGKIL